MGNIPPQLAIFASAALLFLIVRAPDIQILCKNRSQRTKREQQRVERGLLRSFLLEFLVFVPASAALVLMISPLAMPSSMLDSKGPLFAVYALLGLASYGFPFAAIRTTVTRIALNTLKEFAAIVPEEPADQEDE